MSPLGTVCFGLLQPSVFPECNPYCWFAQPDVMGTPLFNNDASGLGVLCRIGNPHSSRNLPILNHNTISVGPAHFVTSLLLPVSVWFLLYIVGYKHSIYLVFKWFSMMVILQFSFNIDVILGGDKHSLPSWLEVSMWLLYVLLDIWIPFGTKKRVVLKYIPFFKEQK